MIENIEREGFTWIKRDNIALIRAGTVAAGVSLRLARATSLREMDLVAMTGVSGAVVMLYGYCDGIRLSRL